MASPERIESFFRQNMQLVRNISPQLKAYVDDQRKREAEIITRTNSFCPLDQISDRTAHAEDVQRALQEGYDDGNVLRSLMCLNNSLALFPEGAGVGRNYKVRNYIRGLRQIGGESADGYAMLADIKGKVGEGKNIMVVKSPRRISPELRASQVHEYFIGVYGTNRLRSNIPNFAYILGFFQCSPPYIDSAAYLVNEPVPPEIAKSRQALTYCQNDVTDNQVNYLLYENVSNSKTLHDFIADGCSFEEFLNVYVQLILATNTAHKTTDFTHYDLHDENVLVRELPEETFIPYEVDSEGTVKYLRTKYVATIIDFGRSHIKYDNQDYGYDLLEGGIYPDRSYPMCDIYKILLFSLAQALFGDLNMQQFAGMTDEQIAGRGIIQNSDVYENGKELVSFFYPQLRRDPRTGKLDTVGDYLIKTRKYYYSLPFMEEYNIPTVSFYQSVVVKIFSDILNGFMFESPTGNLYGCGEKEACTTLSRALTDFSKPDTDYISDPYTFYEITVERDIVKSSTKLEEIGLTSKVEEVPNREIYETGRRNFPNYMDKLLADSKLYLTEYNELRQEFQMISLVKEYSSARFQEEFLNAYRRFVAKTVKMIDQLTSIANIEIIMATLIKIYPNEAKTTMPTINAPYSQIISIIFRPIRSETVALNEAIRSIQADVQYINSLNRDQQETILKADPQARWLFEKMPSLATSVTQFSI